MKVSNVSKRLVTLMGEKGARLRVIPDGTVVEVPKNLQKRAQEMVAGGYLVEAKADAEPKPETGTEKGKAKNAK